MFSGIIGCFANLYSHAAKLAKQMNEIGSSAISYGCCQPAAGA